MIIPFQKLIDEEIRSNERKSKPQTSWHASSLGNCLRGLYLGREGKKPDEEFDARTLRVFSMGNHMEEWILSLAEKQMKVEQQVRVEDPNLNVSGYVDAVIEYEDEKVVYEIKSKNSRAFWYMDKKGEGANRQHQYQVWIYMHLLDIKEGHIVYISKDDLAILEYPVMLNDEKLKEEVFGILDMLNKAWRKKDPTLLPLPDKKDWQAKYCSYHKQCVAL